MAFKSPVSPASYLNRTMHLLNNPLNILLNQSEFPRKKHHCIYQQKLLQSESYRAIVRQIKIKYKKGPLQT